ncbi:MAG TPA: hypothetical protein VN253_22530 [Kofleriaceae bacterium]|nr:hypothetical protein [Kofleriaceae bacterium]
MRALRTATLLIALAGASTASADDPPPKETPLSAVQTEKLLAFFDELVDQTVKNAADCRALATAVDGVVTRHHNTLELSWWAKQAKKTLPREAQERIDKRALEMVGALQRCWNDDGVKAAFKRMKPPKDPKPPKDAK